MKDSMIGLLAELNELKYRAEIVADVRQELTDQLRAEMTKGYETGLLLVSEMTRADAAETLVLKLQAEVAKIQQLENEISSLRQSQAFKLGRALTSPVRILRGIFT